MQHPSDVRSPVPLAIHHIPLCISFAYFEKYVLTVALLTFSSPPILDPSHLETQLSTGSLTVTVNAQRELCVLSKAGGLPLAADEISSVVRVGIDRVRDLVAMMEAELAKDWDARKAEVEVI